MCKFRSFSWYIHLGLLVVLGEVSKPVGAVVPYLETVLSYFLPCFWKLDRRRTTHSICSGCAPDRRQSHIKLELLKLFDLILDRPYFLFHPFDLIFLELLQFQLLLIRHWRLLLFRGLCDKTSVIYTWDRARVPQLRSIELAIWIFGELNS